MRCSRRCKQGLIVFIKQSIPPINLLQEEPGISQSLDREGEQAIAASEDNQALEISSDVTAVRELPEEDKPGTIPVCLHTTAFLREFCRALSILVMKEISAVKRITDIGGPRCRHEK